VTLRVRDIPPFARGASEVAASEPRWHFDARRVNHFSPLGFSLRCTALQNSGSKMLNSAARVLLKQNTSGHKMPLGID